MWMGKVGWGGGIFLAGALVGWAGARARVFKRRVFRR